MELQRSTKATKCLSYGSLVLIIFNGWRFLPCSNPFFYAVQPSLSQAYTARNHGRAIAFFCGFMATANAGCNEFRVTA